MEAQPSAGSPGTRDPLDLRTSLVARLRRRTSHENAKDLASDAVCASWQNLGPRLFLEDGWRYANRTAANLLVELRRREARLETESDVDVEGLVAVTANSGLGNSGCEGHAFPLPLDDLIAVLGATERDVFSLMRAGVTANTQLAEILGITRQAVAQARTGIGRKAAALGKNWGIPCRATRYW